MRGAGGVPGLVLVSGVDNELEEPISHINKSGITLLARERI